MKMRKRTEITIEEHRLLLVRRRGESIQMRCAECGEQSSMVPPHQAAGIAGVSVRAINRWVEAGMVHFAEGSDGQLFVCLNSLGEEISH